MAISKFEPPAEWDETLVELYRGYLDLTQYGGLFDEAAEADVLDELEAEDL